MDDIVGRIDKAADIRDAQRPKRTRKPRGYESKKCIGHTRTGAPCPKWAMLGTTVCDTHGGRAPQVKKAARARLAELVDPSIKVMATILKTKPSARNFIRPGNQIAVAKDILDRNGMKPKEEIVLSAEFDPTQFSNMTDDEVLQLLTLARKASTMRDVHDRESE